ncbi:DNRLRE domain-containing protein [Luteolibacter pohnpeiensis]|uniref:DNRLRE domain-containing protein n=1 Tax=Luteolibacter pohnpeiensis TaxID=454153 RepID=A0A934S7U3_9BACT|nr:PEP-CTERM sorting domain-containing protein [Luteolibacter pohnpeiensis]MBK1881292.1 DNRLRE domain-containing protein [Luteolibacter pohnpeiensis]
MKYISRFLTPVSQPGMMKKMLTPLVLLGAFNGIANASTVLTASSIGYGNYYVQSIPSFGAAYLVDGGEGGVGELYNDYLYEFNFAYLNFDLTGITEEVESAVLTIQLESDADNQETAAALDVYALTSTFADLDGTVDGDFMDYVSGGPGDLAYEGGAPPNYQSIEGDPDAATDWYDSNFGSETIAVSPVGTLTFDGTLALSYATIDITDLVNAWIRGETENLGIGLIVSGTESNTIEISTTDSETYGYTAPTLTVTQVPEPSSILLIALGGLASVGFRRRA